MIGDLITSFIAGGDPANAAIVEWEAHLKKLVGGPADPESIRRRKEERIRPPLPGTITIIRLLWTYPEARAVMLAALMSFRRVPVLSQIISEALAFVEMAAAPDPETGV